MPISTSAATYAEATGRLNLGEGIVGYQQTLKDNGDGTFSLTLTLEDASSLEEASESETVSKDGYFTAPADGRYQIELWGGNGGSGNASSYGEGGYVYGIVTLKKGETLFYQVGGNGQQTTSEDSGTVRGEFVPPEFDPAAVSGTPAQVASHRGYGNLTLNQDTTVSMCANVYIENNAALVYLTAREGNTGWIKIKILDTDGTILGESGLLRPGEYVKSVALSRVPAAGTIVTVKILVYEPETYLSLGSATAQVRIAGPEQ